MGTVATLAVNVIARTGDFNKGLDKAGTKAKGFGKSVGSASGGMSKMIPIAAAGAAALAAVAVVAAKVGEAFNRMDEAAKKARSMGMAAQDLMAFQHAAQLGGVSADKMATALQKMQKGIGEGLAGTGKAKDAMERMGLSMEHIGQLPAKEQMYQIADAIAAIKNPAERAAAATAIFGGAGADMLPVLEGGSAALKAQEADLKSLQGELTTADFKAIEDSNDAWTRFGTAMEGVWDQIAVLVAPALEMIGNILASVAGWVANLIQGFREWTKGIREWLMAANPMFQWLAEVVGLVDDETVAVENLTAAQKKYAAQAKLAMEEEKKAIEEAAKAREALEKKGVALTTSMRSPMEKYNDTVGDLNAMLDAGVISWDTYGRAVAKAQDDIKKSEEFKAKEIKVAERQAVGVSLRGRGAFSIQQKQQRTLEKLREEERQQLKEAKRQTALLQQLNNNVQTGTVVTI
jgi:hypothetical protein